MLAILLFAIHIECCSCAKSSSDSSLLSCVKPQINESGKCWFWLTHCSLTTIIIWSTVPIYLAHCFKKWVHSGGFFLKIRPNYFFWQHRLETQAYRNYSYVPHWGQILFSSIHNVCPPRSYKNEVFIWLSLFFFTFTSIKREANLL